MARIPAYRMIADDLIARIHNGELPPSSQLPTEAEIAENYSVSRMTARQAVTQLESAKLVVRRRGSGSYVRDTVNKTRPMRSLMSFADELATAGSTVENRILVQEVVDEAPIEISAQLSGNRSVRCTRLVRVRVVDGMPASFQDAWIPFAVAPGLARDELTGGSLYRTLKSRYGIELGWADQIVSSAVVTEELAEPLEESIGNPLLTIQRTTYSTSNHPVEFVRSWTRCDFPLALRLEAS